VLTLAFLFFVASDVDLGVVHVRFLFFIKSGTNNIQTNWNKLLESREKSLPYITAKSRSAVQRPPLLDNVMTVYTAEAHNTCFWFTEQCLGLYTTHLIWNNSFQSRIKLIFSNFSTVHFVTLLLRPICSGWYLWQWSYNSSDEKFHIF